MCAPPIRRAPDRQGGRLFQLGLHGLGLKWAYMLGFLVDGLRLGAFGFKFECFGPKLKVSDLSNLL